MDPFNLLFAHTSPATHFHDSKKAVSPPSQARVIAEARCVRQLGVKLFKDLEEPDVAAVASFEFSTDKKRRDLEKLDNQLTKRAMLVKPDEAAFSKDEKTRLDDSGLEQYGSTVIPEWPKDDDEVASSVKVEINSRGAGAAAPGTPTKTSVLKAPSTPTLTVLTVAPAGFSAGAAGEVTGAGVAAPSTPRSSRKSASRSEEVDEEAEYFLNQEPKDWYSFYRNETGSIKIDLTDCPVNKRIIYIFRNKITGRCLIGRTGVGLAKRVQTYMRRFNKVGSENRVKEEGTKAFLVDVKNNPANMEVGILHYLKSKENASHFERRFIQCKRTKGAVYNENEGGGGGYSHGEEVQTEYAIPKAEKIPLTPDRYYSFTRKENGDIRLQLTPGFDKRVTDMASKLEPTQGFIYVAKHLDTGQRYTGLTHVPKSRLRGHGYKAQSLDPQHPTHNPARTGSLFHRALVREPDQFVVGLMPIISKENIPPNELDNYDVVKGIGQAERHTMTVKHSHVSEGGLNVLRGGGGCLAGRAIGILPMPKS